MAPALRRLLRLALCLTLVAPGFAGADTPGAPPSVNAPFRDPDMTSWTAVFEREGREVYDRREDIVRAVGLKPGMDVADVGAGTGLFTRLFAREVAPGGTVYAVDIAASFVDGTLDSARSEGLDNVTGVVNEETDAGLAPASVDLVFICDTYHHFEYPRQMMTSIHRALRPDGSVVVVDYRKIDGTSSSWVMGHVRAGKETVIREIEAAGFRLVEDRDMLSENYFLRFARTDARH
jgi:predicted methyltransferase